MDKISVIMPVYNGQKFIKEAIESVLVQTYQKWELIIVDDNSQDCTAEIIEEFIKKNDKIIYIKNNINMGVSYSRNIAIDKAKGSFIAFLDCDDIWINNKLEKQLKFIVEKNCDMVCTSYDLVDENSNFIKKFIIKEKIITYNELLKDNFIGCSTVLCKSSILKKYKFKTEFLHEDFVLWLQILKNGYILYSIKESLTIYRIVKNSRSNNKIDAAKARWKIYRNVEKLKLISSIKFFCIYIVRGIIKYFPMCKMLNREK